MQRAWMSQLVKYLDLISQIYRMSKYFIPVQYICSTSMESLLLGVLFFIWSWAAMSNSDMCRRKCMRQIKGIDRSKKTKGMARSKKAREHE